MKQRSALTAVTKAGATLMLALFVQAIANAQSGPAIKIVLPERFRVLSDQLFDLRGGMVMTYALDNITPDSANTGTAWTTGNKTINGTLNVFPDNTDFKYVGTNTTTQQATKQWALDNPRIETLWEYLKRL